MKNQTTVAGKDYWPDASDWPANPPLKPLSLIWQTLVFMLVFIALQAAWLMVRDHALGHFIRGDVTVKPAVNIINLLSPNIGAVANGNQIQAAGGGIVVKLGCEGLEALFILMAAIISTHLTWTAKLKGILVGSIFIYLCNQLRILSLFYAFRTDKDFFYFLHGTLAPIVLVALSGLFFNCWLMKYMTTKHTCIRQ